MRIWNAQESQEGDPKCLLCHVSGHVRHNTPVVKWKVFVANWGTSRIGKMKSEEIDTKTLSDMPRGNSGARVMS